VTRIAPTERRKELVAAAIRVIVREGMAAATTRAVAAEAQMSLASLHYVFGSRDALLEAVIERVTAEELQAATEGLLVFDDQNAPVSMEGLLVVGVDRYVDILIASPFNELALAELTVYASRSGLTDLLSRQRQIYLEAARQNLQRAADQAGVGWTVPLTEAANLLVTLLDGITYAWLAHRDEAAARASGRFSARALAALAVPQTTPQTSVHAEGVTQC
jgi:TetR/AcrR family transcriptional regulator, regulator of biofilm formation and stress response